MVDNQYSAPQSDLNRKIRPFAPDRNLGSRTRLIFVRNTYYQRRTSFMSKQLHIHDVYHIAQLQASKEHRLECLAQCAWR